MELFFSEVEDCDFTVNGFYHAFFMNFEKFSAFL